MEKLQLRYTPDEAELIARNLELAADEQFVRHEVDQLREQAARLNHLAARARARAARAAAD